ncbi:nucleotidyltransferase family protein [Salinimonas sediminis]|uniref:Nucleotidyltransferase family protein n=1 Tax=Salinimonas sediminis TaxID=2303538 RepID=A0A346NLJ6_9ALTE|nr:nucleotidyltransferase family protein [Salinimonas sediminis]AXR06403.1 nucleotidyltransferase family protein [Salinimonas sediminis]
MSVVLGVAILAAGKGRRFGGNKLLATLGSGQCLLDHTLTQCSPLSAVPVVVVSGAYHDALSQHPFSTEISLVHNTHWQQGMSGSIALAVKHMQRQHPEVTHLLITLGDLPLVTTTSLRSLWDVAKTEPATIIASFWEGKATAPAIFPKQYWPVLAQLSGDQGAGMLLREGMAQSPPACIPVPHGEASVDIDTQQNLAALSS